MHTAWISEVLRADVHLIYDSVEWCRVRRFYLHLTTLCALAVRLEVFEAFVRVDVTEVDSRRLTIAII